MKRNGITAQTEDQKSVEILDDGKVSEREREQGIREDQGKGVNQGLGSGRGIKIRGKGIGMKNGRPAPGGKCPIWGLILTLPQAPTPTPSLPPFFATQTIGIAVLGSHQPHPLLVQEKLPARQLGRPRLFA